jgi:ABC-type sugar transport system ATPase subunit
MSAAARLQSGPLLSLDGVAKSFAGVRVLKDVSFSVAPGQVVALMGENGAGKSTLKNILCGLVAPDSGRLVVNGKAYARLSTEDARELGIAAIHQELSLFPNLSVAENVHIGVGSMPMRLGLIDQTRMRQRAVGLLKDFLDDEVDPDQLVESLSLGERQLVEVAKALHRASAMLIFDEPTTSLSVRERRRLFDIVRRLRDSHYALIYITHFMEEVYELADRIVVLRDGSVVGSGRPQDISRDQLATMMAGRELAAIDSHLAVAQSQSRSAAAGPVVMKVESLSDATLLHDVSFELHAGEVLGLAGLMGAGRTEVAQAIFGINPASGRVEIQGELFAGRTPEAAKRHGLALVSEDRRSDQIFAPRSVSENLTSATLGSLRRGWGLLSRARQREQANALARDYGVRHPGLDTPMTALSGGNQQKCVVARWLATKPVVCILDEPTKGIDVGAKAEIHLLISKLAAEGLGVLLISSDLPELLALSHRILVMHKGRIVGQLGPADFDPGTVVTMASMGRAA